VYPSSPHPLSSSSSSSSYDDNLASAANRRLRPTSRRRRLSNATNNITVLISSGRGKPASDPHPSLPPSVRRSICPGLPRVPPAGRPGRRPSRRHLAAGVPPRDGAGRAGHVSSSAPTTHRPTGPGRAGAAEISEAGRR